MAMYGGGTARQRIVLVMHSAVVCRIVSVQHSNVLLGMVVLDLFHKEKVI